MRSALPATDAGVDTDEPPVVVLNPRDDDGYKAHPGRGLAIDWLTARSTPMRIHGLSLIIGFVVLMVIDHTLYFTADEWDFLVYRGFHHPALGWMVPHNEHWSALPILIWRLLFTLVGLHHYWPYLAFATLAHLLALHMLWRIAIRINVTPWLATAIVAGSIPLGVGYQNLIYAFQLGFMGSVAFGMWAILLALGLKTGWRQGPRIIAVWTLAILGLACTGVGVTMVVGAALITLLVKGFRPAVLVAFVPALVYAGWYEEWGKGAVATDPFAVNSTNYHMIPGFIANGFSASLSGWLDFTDAGPVVFFGLVAVVATRRWRGVEAVPLAFLVTSGVFFLITATGRVGLGAVEAGASRYSYVAILLLLPAILVGLDRWVRRGGLAVPLALSLLLAASGIVRINTYATTSGATERLDRNFLVADATVLRSDPPVLAVQPIADDAGLTPKAMRALDAQGQLSSFPRASAAGIAKAHFDLQVATSPALVPGDLKPTLVGSPESTGINRVRGCLSFAADASGPTVVLRTGPTTTSVAIMLPAAGSVGVSLTSQNSTITSGPNPVTFAAGRTWLRVSDPDSVIALTLPAGTAELCHIGLRFQ